MLGTLIDRTRSTTYICKCEFCGWRSQYFIYLNTDECPESPCQLDYEHYFFRAIAQKSPALLFKPFTDKVFGD
ncbi:hypothetical protein IQ252_07055 [Tychonema sp. LEGE 07203]|nr:hypothetical protein [Tychonema sp. LEGE 07203]